VKVHILSKQCLLCFVISLILGLCAIEPFTMASVQPAPVSTVGHWLYLPFVARPVSTPTPTPTVTPLPPLFDVRVESSCSNFTGGSMQDPSGEYVCFKNYDASPADMSNWYVQDEKAHTYVFPPFVLQPGAIVRLHSGPGADTATDLHWGRGLVWNNDHDTVYLYDVLGRLISRYVY